MKSDKLTDTEVECLRLRYELGYDNKNIAAILKRSVRTVENHFRFAAAKLNAVGGRGKLMVTYNKMKVL